MTTSDYEDFTGDSKQFDAYSLVEMTWSAIDRPQKQKLIQILNV